MEKETKTAETYSKRNQKTNFNKKRKAIQDSIQWINDTYASNTNDTVLKFSQTISEHDFIKYCLTLGLKKEEAEEILKNLSILKQIERCPSLFNDKMEYFRKLGTKVEVAKLKKEE